MSETIRRNVNQIGSKDVKWGMHARATPHRHRSSTTFCRTHRSAVSDQRPASSTVPRAEPVHRCPATANSRRTMLLGGVASWALLTAGTMLLLSALTV